MTQQDNPAPADLTPNMLSILDEMEADGSTKAMEAVVSMIGMSLIAGCPDIAAYVGKRFWDRLTPEQRVQVGDVAEAVAVITLLDAVLCGIEEPKAGPVQVPSSVSIH